jgi:hypothetical protein
MFAYFRVDTHTDDNTRTDPVPGRWWLSAREQAHV